jgi:hypothetical protein
MTKAENRAAARAYAAEKKRQFEEHRECAGRAADLEALRSIRDYLIFHAKNRVRLTTVSRSRSTTIRVS